MYNNYVNFSWLENFNGGLNNTMFKVQYRELGGSISDAKEKMCPAEVSTVFDVFFPLIFNKLRNLCDMKGLS